MAVLICTTLLSIHIPLQHRTAMEQMSTCLSVVAESQTVAIDPVLSASLAWHETRLHPGLTSRAGAKGPLQVLPRFWCKAKPCDYIKAGLKALRYYLSKERTERKAICRYNAGTCKPKSWAWAGKVMRLTKRARKITEKHSQSQQ